MTYKTTSRSSGYPSVTATARVMDNLALYGHTPHADEPEYRPIPEDSQLEASVEAMFSAVTGPLTDSALEDDVDEILWSLVNALHHKENRIQRRLDDNEAAQRDSHEQQDGSEVRSVELERLTLKGQELMERRNAFEHMRRHAEAAFEEHTGKAWLPKSGSLVNRGKPQTAAMVDSRDYIAAKRYADTNVMIPPGTRIAVAGGINFEDYATAYAVLDELKARTPQPMVLLHGGADKGIDRITATWAKNRGVNCVAFKPDWNRHQNAAPFKRNDAMLDAGFVELVVFAGNGITDNLADKAKKAGIRLTDKRGRAA